MSYQSYNTVHKMPGVVLNAEIPTAADDMTAMEPVLGEVRADEAYIYVCTACVPGTSCTWGRVAVAAWA